MEYIKKNKIILSLIFVTVLFLMKVFKTAYKLENLNYGYIVILFFFSLLFYLLFFKVIKKAWIRILVFIGIGACIFAAFLYYNSLFYEFYTSVGSNLNTANDLMSQGKDIDYSLLKYIFGSTIFFITQLLFFFIDKRKNNLIIIVSFICMLILWYTGFVEEVKTVIFPFIFLSITTYAFNRIAEKISVYSNNGVGIMIKKKELLTYILVISFTISILQVIIPQNMKGKLNIQGDTFKNAFFSDDDAKKIDNSKYYRYSIKDSGYSDSNEKLGGPVTIQSGTVMKVKADKPYYLKAVIKDYYDGFSFKRTGDNYIKYNKKNTTQKLITNDKFLQQGKKQTLIIDPLEMKTTTVFAPNNTYRVDFLNNSVFYNNDLTFMSDDHKGNDYTDNFYDSADYIDIFNDKYIDAYEEVSSMDKYKVQEKYKDYLQVPSIVPLTVYNTVYDLVKGAKNDAEKVSRIQAYLKNNFKYTLDVSEVPKDQEFISYFLFKEKKGYCTYFAASATIFCRIAGIPARYVEGFHMENVEDNSGFYLVDNEDAHAWTEVMLSPSMDTFTILDCVPNATEQLRKEKNSGPTVNINHKNAERNMNEKDKNNTNQDVSKKAKTNKESMYKTSYTLYLILAAILAYIIISIIIHNNKVKKIIVSPSNIPLYVYSKKRLKTCGINLYGPITDLEAVNLIYNEELKEKLSILVKYCYDEYYGGIKDDFDKKSFYIFIEHFISQRQNKLIYIFKKYFTRI